MIALDNKIQIHPKRSKKRWWWILVWVGLALVIGVVSLFIMANWPMWQDRSRSISAAEKIEKVHQINHFYFADKDQVYYTVQGIRDGKKYYVIMNHHYHPVRVINSNRAVNHAYIINRVKSHHNVKKIFSAAPTIFNGKAAWVVSYENRAGKLCYHTFSFRSGHSIQLINNL